MSSNDEEFVQQQQNEAILAANAISNQAVLDSLDNAGEYVQPSDVYEVTYTTESNYNLAGNDGYEVTINSFNNIEQYDQQQNEALLGVADTTASIYDLASNAGSSVLNSFINIEQYVQQPNEAILAAAASAGSSFLNNINSFNNIEQFVQQPILAATASVGSSFLNTVNSFSNIQQYVQQPNEAILAATASAGSSFLNTINSFNNIEQYVQQQPILGATDTTELLFGLAGSAGSSFLSTMNSFNKKNGDPKAPDTKEIFSLTGPSFLTNVDWNNSHHRRSVAASLVHGVYCLESDRRQNRQGHQALAPPWWQFFNFKLIQPLLDKQDGSFFGAIYELISTDDKDGAPASDHKPPHYVIAFRGTINTKGNREQDHRLHLQLTINNLENSPRFQTGLECTTRFVQAGPGNVWLAGHALGSSLALLLGKQMVKAGFHVETYLFNPPFASPHIERIKNEGVKRGLRFANSVLTAGIAAAVSPKKREKEAEPFSVLASWVPYLFINSNDPICSEYVGYFKHREDMEGMGPTARKIGRLATKHSIRDIFAVARGKTNSEAVHIIPSAYLTINGNDVGRNFRESHAIHQWWRLDLQFDYKYYQYK